LKLSITNGENPMNIKRLIAKNIITQYHDPESAEQAEMFFTNQFQNKNDDEKVFEPVSLNSLNNRQESMTLSELCHQLKNKESKSFIRRLIINGGIQINHQKITNPDEKVAVTKGTKIKIGKRSFFELL
uniref:S4 domain-containing protein n=1 Tax=uncultured Chryseobacterium sp. TaxID=259322 RepID=UPI0025CC56B0